MEHMEILIVEDSQTQVLRLKSILEQEGFKVHHAVDGKEAIATLASITPTLIISDVVMPNMDGYEFCTAVKTDPRLKDIPVILITNLSDPSDVILALNAGADNFLAKPYDEQVLVSKIHHVLANMEIRKHQKVETGVEVYFADKRYSLSSSRIQMVDLLLSTYESAVQKNQELYNANKELNEALRSIVILQRNYLQLLETNIDAIFVVDDGNLVRYANPSANKLLAPPVAIMVDREFPIPLDSLGNGEFEMKDTFGGKTFLDVRKIKTDWNGKEMTLCVLRDVSDAVRLRRELQQLSLTDDLTGLYNRRGFMIFAARAVPVAKRLHQKVFVLFADLDGLKRINDTIGHQVGDVYLAASAKLLTVSFREVDTIARMGGDEFAVLGIITDECIPQMLVDRLENNIDAYNNAASRAYPLSMSIGISTYNPAIPVAIEEVIDRADEAMYKQKELKRTKGK